MYFGECCEVMRQIACPLLTAIDLEPGGMQRMSRQQETPLQFRRPARLDEFEIKLLVRPINLVAHDGMA